MRVKRIIQIKIEYLFSVFVTQHSVRSVFACGDHQPKTISMRSIYAFRSGKQVEGRIFAILIACLLLLGFPFEVAAQRTGSKTFIISGQVTDAQTKQPIPGVAVMLKATNVGVTTDSEGKYFLGVNDPNAILVVSFLGYKNVEEHIGNRTQIDFALEMDSRSVEDVVVVGYGNQKRHPSPDPCLWSNPRSWPR